MSASAVAAVAADDHSRAIAWFRAFLHAIRSDDTSLRRLAQRELRVLGVAVAPVPAPYQEPSEPPRREMSATSATEIPSGNERCLLREIRPDASVPSGKVAGDNGDER